MAVAAACHPERGSEPGIGWLWARNIATHHDVTVIAGDYDGNREAIESILAADHELAGRLRFVFIPWIKEPSSRLGQLVWNYYQPLFYRKYAHWMAQAQAAATALVCTERFDITHQITLGCYREPGVLWTFPMPFVWGPLGGTQNVPNQFLFSLGLVEGARHLARNVINHGQFRYSRRVRLAIDRASAVFSVATNTQEQLLRVHGKSSDVVASTFCNPHHPDARVRSSASGPLRFVFSALHLSRKGLPFALRALTRVPTAADWRLDVLGDGVMRRQWEAEADLLGLRNRVSFRGYLNGEELREVMTGGDVFVLPSLQDSWPAVVADALSLGMPVITTDLHGMHDMITDECGYRVDASTPNSLVDGLESAFRDLLFYPDRLAQLSRGALARAEALSADRQLPVVLAAYERAIAVNGANQEQFSQ